MSTLSQPPPPKFFARKSVDVCIWRTSFCRLIVHNGQTSSYLIADIFYGQQPLILIQIAIFQNCVFLFRVYNFVQSASKLGNGCDYNLFKVTFFLFLWQSEFKKCSLYFLCVQLFMYALSLLFTCRLQTALNSSPLVYTNESICLFIVRWDKPLALQQW